MKFEMQRSSILNRSKKKIWKIWIAWIFYSLFHYLSILLLKLILIQKCEQYHYHCYKPTNLILNQRQANKQSHTMILFLIIECIPKQLCQIFGLWYPFQKLLPSYDHLDTVRERKESTYVLLFSFFQKKIHLLFKQFLSFCLDKLILMFPLNYLQCKVLLDSDRYPRFKALENQRD